MFRFPNHAEKRNYFVLKCTTTKTFREENFKMANLLFTVGNFVLLVDSQSKLPRHSRNKALEVLNRSSGPSRQEHEKGAILGYGCVLTRENEGQRGKLLVLALGYVNST